MSKVSLKSNQSRREVESVHQKLLSDDDDVTDDEMPWRLNNEILADSYNNNRSIAPARYLLRMLSSIGLCFSVIFIVFDSFKILLAAVIFDNLLSIGMMVLSVMYMNKCPLQKNLSPALFAYAFTKLIKSLLSIWNNRASFQSSNSGGTAQPQSKSLFGKRLQFILFNGLQLISLGFFIFSSILVLPLYSTMDAADLEPEDLNSTRHCNKLLYWYSFSFVTLNGLYTLIFLAWIPCILCCLLRD